MNPGCIYVLQNKSFGNNLIKIGKTTREPDTRAYELSGGSGIPEKFHVSYACKVADCSLAEKEIHHILRSYRSNKKREFFVISVEIAKKIIADICREINKKYNYCPSDLVVTDEPLDSSIKNCNDNESESLYVRFDQVVFSPPGTSSLNNEQKIRVEIISEILKDAWTCNYENWAEDFSRNTDPETEIKVWENIAKAFLRIDRIELLSEDQIQEVLLILIWRSMESPSKVLKKINLNFLSKRVAKEILNEYEEPPSPITGYLEQ